MRKVLIIVVSFLLFVCAQIISYAQDKINNLHILKDWQVKGMAKSAMRMGDVYQARDFLKEWNRRDPKNTKIALKLGSYYFKARDYGNAEKILAKIVAGYPDSYPEAKFYYAQILKIYGDYEGALVHLQALRRKYRRLGGTGLTRFRLDNEIAGCQKGIESRDIMVKTEVSWLNKTINSPHIEFGPVLLGESTFVYGSANLDSTAYIDLSGPYKARRNFYMAKRNNEEWTGGLKPEPPFENFNNFDTGRGVFSGDRKRFYSVQCHMDQSGVNICHLFVSKLNEGKWGKPEKLGKKINHPRYNSTQPAIGTCFSSSLEIIYFVSNRKGGAGGQDIWFTVYDKRTGEYKKAENAGAFINTQQDEITPFFDLPSHKLYFSSNGWPTMGGYDIFYAKGDMTTWEPPVNIGLPVNSSYDDLNFVQNHSGKFGIFASNRPGSLSLSHQACCDDLYVFNETESPRVLVTGKLVKEDVIKESGKFKPISGNQNENKLLDDLLPNQLVTVQMLKDSTSSVLLQEIQTNNKGEFELWVEPGMDFFITVENPAIINKRFSFSTKQSLKAQVLDVSTISLKSISEESVIIDNIYYQFDQVELAISAKLAIDTTLLLLLTTYPSIKVEISSHTDNLGDEGYNLRLSEKRAKEVLTYLVSKGINANRLTAKGYGEKQPIKENQKPDGSDNPEGREQNRRTEFKITGIYENQF